MPEVTLTVPGDHGELFQREAARTLAYAVGNLDECLRWDREGRRKPEPGEREGWRRYLVAAERLVGQVEDELGELRVEADVEALKTTLTGALLDAADELKGACELLDGTPRAALEECEMWLGMLESVEGAS